MSRHVDPTVRYVDGLKTVPCQGCGTRVYYDREDGLIRDAADKQPHTCPPSEIPR